MSLFAAYYNPFAGDYPSSVGQLKIYIPSLSDSNPTSQEIRPVNMAIRYLIRAEP